MRNYEGYYRFRELKHLGWDQSTVDKYIGEPDQIKPSQVNGQVIRLYKKDRVDLAYQQKKTDEKILHDSIPKRHMQMQGFNKVYAMLNLYEQLTKEDFEATLGEPDETGERDIDNDKYDDRIVNNPNEEREIRLWEKIREEIILVWNAAKPEERDAIDLANVIERIEDMHNFGTNVNCYIDTSYLEDELEETAGVEINHEYPDQWHIEHLCGVHHTITITKRNGCCSEIIKGKSWY